MNILLSYAHEDDEWRQQLRTHLAALEQDFGVRIWDDRAIPAGGEWKEAIEEQLRTADIVLLLVSPDFRASEFIRSVELRQALERHDLGEARVIPVILRACEWQSAPFARLQPLPRSGKPLASWDDRDEAFFEVVRELREIISAPGDPQNLKERRPQPSYLDPRNRALSHALETAYRREQEAAVRGEDTSEIREEILDLRRRIREGGLKPGDFLLDGRYQLLEKIGEGGFARVWKAWDYKHREVVAVKILHYQYAEDRTRCARFLRGARKMSGLQHPGIVRVLGEPHAGEIYPFFVMELLDGGDLRQAVLSGKVSKESSLLRIVQEVGLALTYAHGKGLIHRDVKPANILLDASGQAKLTDFDLVWAQDTTAGTRTGMMGTVVYAAPEAMIRAQDADERADVFGLGMTAVFGLYGAHLPPHELLRDAPGFVRKLRAHEVVKSALVKAVAWERSERWGSIAEFCQALAGDLVTQVSAPELGWHLQPSRLDERLRVLERESLGDFIAAIASGTDAERLAEESLQGVVSLLNARRGALYLIDETDEFRLSCSVGAARERFQADRSTVVESATAQDQPLIPEADYLLAVPIESHGRSWGLLVVADKENRHTVESFSATDRRLLLCFAELTAVALASSEVQERTLEMERLEHELRLAAVLQQQLLSSEEPQIPGFDAIGWIRMVRHVGGDYFAVKELADGQWALVVADVSGKGLPAAMLVSTLHSALRILLDTMEVGPQLMQHLNRHINDSTLIEKYITLLLVKLDTRSRRLDYLNAGHAAGLLVRGDGSVERLSPTNLPLGLLPDTEYSSEQLFLEPDDLLCLYSDGITESVSPDTEEEFGVERLLALLKGRQDRSLDDLVKEIGQATADYTQGLQDDDQALVLLRPANTKRESDFEDHHAS